MEGPGHIPCSVMVGSGTCLHPAGLGGSQFTMTLWMGYAQTPEIENGDQLGPPQACRGEAGAGSDHDGTRNMSRAVHLLYLFRYQIGGGMAVLSHGFVST